MELDKPDYVIKQLQLGEDSLHAQLFMPEDLIYFDGHFDEIPVLPGVVQVHWVMELAKKNFDMKGDFSSIDTLKFMRIIQPKMSVDLTITYHRKKSMIEFAYSSGDQPHSSGKIKFA